MKLHSILRTLSIVCYSFICLQGMIIAIPFILVLTFGIGDAEPTTKPLLILADLALIALIILSIKKKSRITIVLECIIFFLLLSPLVKILTAFPLQMFGYFLFAGPFAGFVILYPLSLLFSCLDYRKSQKTTSFEL